MSITERDLASLNKRPVFIFSTKRRLRLQPVQTHIADYLLTVKDFDFKKHKLFL